MKKDFVSFEIAKLLKEKGFNDICRYRSSHALTYQGEFISFDEQKELEEDGKGDEIIDKQIIYESFNTNKDNDGDVYSIPSLWDVMNWLREEKHIYIQIMLDGFACGGRSGYFVILQKTDSDYEHMLSDFVETVFYKTYEEATEDAIKYCLEKLI